MLRRFLFSAFVTGLCVLLFWVGWNLRQRFITAESNIYNLNVRMNTQEDETAEQWNHTRQNRVVLESILADQFVSVVNQYDLGITSSCGEIQNRLINIKAAFELLDETKEKSGFKTQMKELQEANENERDLIYIEQCLIREGK